MSLLSAKEYIVQQAKDLQFSFVGFSKAEQLDEEARQLEAWLNQGNHGQMSYMANHFDKRIDPTKLVPGAQTVISLLFNYFTTQRQEDLLSPKISQYAFGEDYHHVIKKRLKELLNRTQEQFGSITGRCFVDSAPVMERQWAARSGLGWTGKNTLLIHPKAGSYFFLAEIICDLKIEPDHPIRDHCGTCTKCIEACPTDAIAENGYILDASKCISYLTIELKDAIPTEFKGKMDNWMFGCDICQHVCPWNRFSKQHQVSEFEPKDKLLTMQQAEWMEITKDVFDKLFQKSAVKRTKFEGLKRNIAFLQ